MALTQFRRSLGILVLSLVVCALTLLLFQGRARAQADASSNMPKSIITTVLDNSRVAVRRDTFPVGGGEAMHASGTVGDNRYVLMILLTPAKLEGTVDGKMSTSDKPGFFWELPGAPSQHAFRNLSNQPIDVMVVQLK